MNSIARSPRGIGFLFTPRSAGRRQLKALALLKTVSRVYISLACVRRRANTEDGGDAREESRFARARTHTRWRRGAVSASGSRRLVFCCTAINSPLTPSTPPPRTRWRPPGHLDNNNHSRPPPPRPPGPRRPTRCCSGCGSPPASEGAT